MVHPTNWFLVVEERDWYDLAWFISRNISLHLHYLEQRMRQTHHWTQMMKLTHKDLLEIFNQKIRSLDIFSAKKDIINFVKDSTQIEVWSKDFCQQVVKKVRIILN